MAEITGNERAAIIGQLVAMRNVLDGVLGSLQEESEPAPAGLCEHPLEKRKYSGAMGDAQFTCEQCGATVAASLDTSRLVRPNTE